ncbi:MAG TPA: 2-oxoacid:acceptor oxidoreductase family protein [Bryobacteraceae bacterium]|jgi:indolepyruvate ferredoxin oxidoreductase beta subunit
MSNQPEPGDRRRTGVTNIVVAGLGGQGVLKASDIIASAAFLAGLDVKKSEVHGMSQRGGSVASDVRFGARVFSPMVSQGEAHFLLVLDAGQIEVNRAVLAPGGVLIEPGVLGGRTLRSAKTLNVALVGALSRHVDFAEALWNQALRANLAPRLLELNLEAFAIGRNAGGAAASPA